MATNAPRNGSSSSVIEFDQLCDEALRDAGELSAAVRDRLVEDLRLRFEHPGEYVAYLDRYKTVNRLRRLQRRVLEHSRDLGEVQAAINRCTKRQRPHVMLEFVEPLGEELTVPHEMPYR